MQELELSGVSFRPEGVDEWENSALLKDRAAWQFKTTIIHLRLISLKLKNADFMDDEINTKLFSDSVVGNLSELRCFLSLSNGGYCLGNA